VKDEIEKYFFHPDGSRKVNTVITTVEHFRWGLLRIYTDALLYFGNITHGFVELSKKTETELSDFFKTNCFEITFEGKEKLNFKVIDRNDRFLISEAVCAIIECEYKKQCHYFTLKKNFIECGVNKKLY
jgi:hypothetical protein